MTFLKYSAFATAAGIAFLAAPLQTLAADVTLRDVSFASPNGKSKATMKTVLATGTNVTEAELKKLFDPAASKEEKAAIAAKMKAELLSIPEIAVTRSDKEGLITIKNISITSINGGKFAKATMEGFDGNIPSETNSGKISMKSGPIVIQDGDFSQALGAVKSGDFTDGAWRFSTFKWSNFELQAPEKSGGQPVYHTVKIGSVEADTKYENGLPTMTKGEIKDIVFMPAANSQAGQGMTMFGYKQVNVGMTFAGSYDAANKQYKLTDFTLNGKDAGVLSLTGVFGNIDGAAFNGDKRQRMMALMAGDADNITIKFVNNGLFDKALAFYATMKGSQPDAVKQELAGMAGGMLPMFLGGDAGAMQSAGAVSEFVKSPKNLTISVKGKMGPVPFRDLAAGQNPMAVLSKLKIEAVSNK